MDWPLLVVIVIVILVAATVLKRLSAGTQEAPRYSQRKLFLTPAERSFYGVLAQAVGTQYRLHTKVRVADVLEPVKGQGRSNWQRAFNRISSKHFDYVLCNPDSMRVEMAIELNDKSHAKDSRKRRDEFLLQACNSAGLKLLSFEAKRAYSIEELRGSLAVPEDEDV